LQPPKIVLFYQQSFARLETPSHDPPPSPHPFLPLTSPSSSLRAPSFLLLRHGPRSQHYLERRSVSSHPTRDPFVHLRPRDSEKLTSPRSNPTPPLPSLLPGSYSIRIENYRDRYCVDIPPSQSEKYIGGRWIDKGASKTVLTIVLEPEETKGGGPSSCHGRPLPAGKRTAVISVEDIHWELVLSGDVEGGESEIFLLSIG